MTNKKKVVIVGGGLSGLTAGFYLLKYGFDVEIVEKNATLGGLCTGWVRKGSYIDGCIHWLTESNHGELYSVMREIGVLADDVPVAHLEAYSQAVTPSATVNFYLDADRLQQELERFATPNDLPKVRQLVDYIRRCRRNLITAGNPYHMWGLIDSIKFIFRIIPLLKVLKRGSTITIDEFADSLESPELRFAFKNTFVPGLYSVFSFANTMGGICDHNSGIPLGGSKAFAYRLVESYKKQGGAIRTNSPVSQILLKGDVATGILLQNGEVINADYVVPACDVHYTQSVLLNDAFPIAQLKEAEVQKDIYPSFSLFMISFRTKADVSNLNVNRYVACEKFKVLDSEYECIYLKHFGYDKSLENDGYTVVQAILECSENGFNALEAMSREGYKSFKDHLATQVTGVIANAVGHEYGELELLDVCTPLTFTHWVNAYKGTFMAHILSKHNRQYILRNDILPLRNVALAGHWMMMPGGVPIAILQGKFAAATIQHMHRFPHKFNLEKALKQLRKPLRKVADHSFFKRDS